MCDYFLQKTSSFYFSISSSYSFVIYDPDKVRFCLSLCEFSFFVGKRIFSLLQFYLTQILFPFVSKSFRREINCYFQNKYFYIVYYWKISKGETHCYYLTVLFGRMVNFYNSNVSDFDLDFGRTIYKGAGSVDLLDLLNRRVDDVFGNLHN